MAVIPDKEHSLSESENAAIWLVTGLLSPASPTCGKGLPPVARLFHPHDARNVLRAFRRLTQERSYTHRLLGLFRRDNPAEVSLGEKALLLALYASQAGDTSLALRTTQILCGRDKLAYFLSDALEVLAASLALAGYWLPAQHSEAVAVMHNSSRGSSGLTRAIATLGMLRNPLVQTARAASRPVTAAPALQNLYRWGTRDIRGMAVLWPRYDQSMVTG